MNSPASVQATRRKLAWHYSGHVVDAVVGLALVAYIARHVSVAAYGIYLFSLAFAGFLALALDLGLSGIIVQAYIARKSGGSNDQTRRLFSAVTVLMGGLGASALALLALLAILVPAPPSIPGPLVPTARALMPLAGLFAAVTLLTSHIEAVHVAWHRFDTLNRVQMFATLVRAAATVGVIALGYGVVALAVVQIGAVLLRGALLFGALGSLIGRPKFSAAECDWPGLVELWRTAKWSLIDNISRAISISADSLILGIFGSMDAVAVYGVGTRVPTQLWAVVNRGVGVAMPSIAEHHAGGHTGQLREAFLRMCRTVFVLIVPVLAVLAFVATSLIEVWAGPAYSRAGVVLRWLLIASVGHAMLAPCYAALYALGKAETAARIRLVESAANLALSLALVVPFGGVGLAAATAVTHVIGTWGWYMPATCRAIGLRARDLVGFIARDVGIPCAVMCAVMGMVWIGVSGTGRLPQMALTAAFGTAAYFAVLYLRARSSGSALSHGFAPHLPMHKAPTE